MVTNLVNQVKNSFLSNSIKLDDEWLSGCVDWATSDTPGLSPEQTYKKAYGQWLLTDLNESGVPCIPVSVFQRKDPFTVAGKFVLQMNSVMDISESSYDQWRRLNDQKLDEPEPVEEFRTQTKKPANKKRLLKLVLTDGTRTVDAMEYQPVECLSTKIFPGCKILISGPLQCSNGVLLLTPANVKILGGEVDTLLIPNAFENMLLKQLNKPLNPKPRMDYNEAKAAEGSQRVREQNRPVVMANFERETQRVQSVQNPPRVASEMDQLMNEDDNLLSGMEMETLEVHMVPSGRPTTQELLEFEREDEDLFTDAAMLDDFDEIAAPNPPDPRPLTSPPRTSHNTADSLQDFVDESLFDEDFLPPPEPQRNPTILDSDYKFRIRGQSLVTIDQLQEVQESAAIEEKSFILRAKFFNVAEKLIIQEEYWNIGIFVTDLWSREKLKIRILSGPLNRLSGRTAKELTEMYKDAKRRPHVKDEIHEILSTVKEKIRKLDCFMRIDFTRELPCPTLVELIDPAPVLNGILREKVRSENLSAQ